MRFFSWLRTQNSGGRPRSFAHQRNAKALRSRPRLETLEDRCVPSTLTVDHNWDNNAPPGVPAPQGTLEWASATAQNGDTIVITGGAVEHGIDLTHGEILLTQQNLTIVTAANKSPATISGDNLSRVFEVAPGASVTLSKLTITGGVGLADNPAGDASQDGHGGGILVDAGATLMVSDSNVSSNSAYHLGGAGNNSYFGNGIYNNGTLTVSNSVLSHNSASAPNTLAGGIYNFGTATLTNCTLSGNSANDGGGGICNVGSSALTLTNCTLSGNSANYGGGGLSNVGTATLTNCTLSGNSAGEGGGIANGYGATVTLTACALSGNSANTYGGGIASNGTVIVSDSTLANNSAYYGGGIYDIRTLTVSGTTFSQNSATYGGAIYIDNSSIFHGAATVTVSASTLSGNSATISGGGIYNIAGVLAVSGSTLSGNSAGQAGGGIYNDTSFFRGLFIFPGTVTVSSSSNISGNTAPVGFGADVYNLGTLFLDASSIITILDGNPAVPI